jgi:hypothetical protein
MIASRAVVARFWPAPVLLLVGLIASESAFEDRQGSGNITDIQHNAERAAPRIAHAPASQAQFAEEEQEPAWFAGDIRDKAEPSLQPPTAPLPETGDLFERDGAQIPMPEHDLIERAKPAA